jgi:hypothetical protein
MFSWHNLARSYDEVRIRPGSDYDAMGSTDIQSRFRFGRSGNETNNNNNSTPHGPHKKQRETQNFS